MALFADMRKWLLSTAIEELLYGFWGYPKLPTDFFIRSTFLIHFYRFTPLRFCHGLSLHFAEKRLIFALTPRFASVVEIQPQFLRKVKNTEGKLSESSKKRAAASQPVTKKRKTMRSMYRMVTSYQKSRFWPTTRLKRKFQAGFRMLGAIRNRRDSNLMG